MNSIILKNISVCKANAMPAWWLAGAPSMIGMFGFIHNLSRKVSELQGEDISIDSFGLIVHSVNVHGVNMPNETSINRNFNDGSAFALPKATSPMVSDSSKPGKSPSGQPLQPSVLMDMEISVVITGEYLNDDIVGSIQDVLSYSRILGGYIDKHGKIEATPSIGDAVNKVGSGFAVFDGSHISKKMEN